MANTATTTEQRIVDLRRQLNELEDSRFEHIQRHLQQLWPEIGRLRAEVERLRGQVAAAKPC